MSLLNLSSCCSLFSSPLNIKIDLSLFWIILHHLMEHRLTLGNDLLLGLCLLFACDGVMMPLSEESMQVARDTIAETALVISE